MKINNIYNRISVTIFFLSLLFETTSCSSRDERSYINSSKGAILKFNVSGVVQGNKVDIPHKRITKQNEEIVSITNFDVLTNVSEKYERAVVLPIDSGIKYRILIYDSSDNHLVNDVEAVSGTSPQILVDAGKSYKWYAISVNDMAVVPSVSGGVVKREDIVNKDVLYASSHGTITPEFGNNNLAIVFNHNTAQFVLQLDTRGLFGRINDTSAVEIGVNQGVNFTSIIQTGDLNLFTGEYSNLQTVPEIKALNMTNAVNAQGDSGATKTAIFYTVNKSIIAASNLKVRLNKLDITLDDSTVRSFTPYTVIPYANVGITPLYGGKYTINARMIESGVKVNGLLWGRSNLYYADNVTHTDKYRFHPNNEYTIASVINLSINGIINLQLNGQSFKVTNEYWNWMSATPTGLSSDNVDPCSKVYPQGVWRMPTNSEFTTLNNNPTLGFDTNTPLLLGGARLSSTWELDSGQQINTVYPINSQKLFISFFGRRSSDGTQIVDSPGSIASILLASGEAYYWTSTKNGSSVFYHNRIYNSLIGTLVGPDPPTMVPGNTGQGRNIRCVRK
ncbi:hypothetical protein BAZ12_15560 [Elizabethkingia miricola]|nr:hypothetical protein BAZ12_15560 [Elizabethkingia miricola]OPC72605.1 hypothetical protein BAZ13_16365 [Elizabethkingia miricola]